MAGEEIHNALYQLVSEIYETGDIPSDYQKCIMIPIPKKTSANRCEQYRTLSLVSHASKILTSIVLSRIEDKVETLLSEDQFGFRKGRGTRDAVLAIRIILEKRLSKDKNTYIAFVDLEKAFDSVDWKQLFTIMKEAKINYKDRRIIWSLYREEIAVLRCGQYEQQAKIRKGVRQGCSLSPALFNLYLQRALDEAENNLPEAGIKVHGQRIYKLCFADDLAVLAESEDQLQEVLREMEVTLARYNLKLSRTKTKTLVVSKTGIPAHITLGNTQLNNVEEFTYLGSNVTTDARSKREINSRIQQAKIAFNKKRKIYVSKNMSFKIKMNLLKTFVWSIMLYGSETWTIGAAEKKKN